MRQPAGGQRHGDRRAAADLLYRGTFEFRAGLALARDRAHAARRARAEARDQQAAPSRAYRRDGR